MRTKISRFTGRLEGGRANGDREKRGDDGNVVARDRWEFRLPGDGAVAPGERGLAQLKLGKVPRLPGTAAAANPWKEATAIHEEAKSTTEIARQQQQAIDSSEGGDQKIEPIRNRGPKVGRNDPCPCGSGKKYKNCHMKKGGATPVA